MNPPAVSPSPLERASTWLRRRLGRAVLVAYTAALFLPGTGLWLRHPHAVPVGPAHLTVRTTSSLLSLVLFSAGLQVPVRALGRVLRRPKAMLAGLALHLAIPLLVLPFVAFLLRRTPLYTSPIPRN